MLLTQPDHSHRRIVSVGMFDGVHEGHRALLRDLLDKGAELHLRPAAVTFRCHPRHLVKPGNRVAMLMSLDERIDKLHRCGIEDVILLDFDEKTRMMSARDFMVMLHNSYDVKAIVMGFNNRFGHDRPEGIEAYREIGAPLGIRVFAAKEYRCDPSLAVSSSAVRHLLASCEVKKATRLLGHPYRLAGRVVHGKELGRTIGFPTANIEPLDSDSVIPGNGVYAVEVHLPGGITRPGMLNIGHRPTVDSPYAPPSIEVNIFDYDADLYGKPVAVDFIAFMRHEQAFESISELTRQLAADRDEARRLCLNG